MNECIVILVIFKKGEEQKMKNSGNITYDINSNSVSPKGDDGDKKMRETKASKV